MIAKLIDTTNAANKIFNFTKTIPLDISLIDTQKIKAPWLINKQISLAILRLDKLDEIISGNKWFKLKYYVENAVNTSKTSIATFGGAWSNHIIATAYAAKEAGLRSIGIIRGEKTTDLSYTLKMALEFGMELTFVSRNDYRNKEQLIDQFTTDNIFWIDEGGYGKPGSLGASEILQTVNTTSYTHIIAAVGTGTMLAGLVLGCLKTQTIIGISSMKGNVSLDKKVRDLIEDKSATANFLINHNYHFDGYGKHPPQLIAFINDTFLLHNLPLDIIYTGKTFYAIKDLVEKNFFPPASKLLMIHSGGLQGNKSLPHKVLAF